MFEIIFLIGVLVMSIVIHEVSHGAMANYLGDPTARLEGRLTLNPISHMDPVGSVILPAVLAFTHAPFLFGWAKPVPYNLYNIRNKWGELLVALAGPASNFALALMFALIFRLSVGVGEGYGISVGVLQMFYTVVLTNLMLCFFNLIPLPPLDGSKILTHILPHTLAHHYRSLRYQMESNFTFAIVATLLLLSFAGNFLEKPVTLLTKLMVGI
jgi:Zn-dependent protease